MDAERAVAEWPDFLVELLAEDIKIAHEINPRSWTIHTYRSRPVISVSKTNILYLNENGSLSILVAPTSLSTDTIEAIGPELLPRGGRSQREQLAGIDVEFVRDRFNDLLPAHHEAVRQLAKHNNNRWKWHRQDFANEFSKRLETNLPPPGYSDDLEEIRNNPSSKKSTSKNTYRSRTEQPTGFWKQTYDLRRPYEKDAYEQVIAEDKLIHRLGHFSSDATLLPSDRAAFTGQIKELDGISDGFAHRLWMFIYGAQPGDWVIAEAPVPAIGQIAGPAYFDEDSHHRDVTWHWIADSEVESRQIRKAYNRRLWGFTTLEPIEFKRILEALGQEGLVDLSHISEPDKQPQLEANVSLLQISSQDIGEHFAASGLHYSETQIADFYTALQTKGFVVLSGISGTGKSKIATGFTELLPHALHTEIAGPDPVTAYQSLRFKVSPTETWAAISSDQSHLFPKTAATTRQQVTFVYEGAAYRGTYRTRTLNYGKPTLYLILGRALSERLRASAGDNYIFAQFRAASNDQALPEVHITLEEPKLSQSTQEVETFTVPNTLFLSVRPDWRDSTSLLGYYNPLTKTYEWTDFLRFILDAAENYRSDNPIAWFVILDEMNLAHVEYYFADLLSVLESGRESDPDHEDFGFTDQPLRLTYPEIVANEAPPTEVRLPPNLYIIGTVNMDETTHAFSPKVLDRAFTMELTEVDFSDYPRATLEDDGETFDEAAKQDFLQVFSQNGEFPQIRKDEIREFVSANEDIRRSIQTLNGNLANYRFHFGYRVFDEIMQFLANAEANEMYDDDGHMTALDSAAFMKILPKFSGSEARVGLPLAALIEWAKDPFAQGEDAAPLERTLKRAEYMQTVLQTDGFVTAF